MRGVFITFEGPEGSGKSTQAGLLANAMRETGRTVVQVREPGGTVTGEAIRQILQHDSTGEAICPEAEALLFEACRAQLVRQVILPALDSGCCVVSDRFADSTTAYQGYGRGFGAERILSLNDFAVGRAVPDLTLLLDIPVREGFARLERRADEGGGGLDRLERESVEFHQRVRDGYRELAGRWPERFVVLDGTRAVEVVAVDVWEAVRTRLDRAMDRRATDRAGARTGRRKAGHDR